MSAQEIAMQFAKPGLACVNCACRKTNPTNMKSWEIPFSFVIPYVMHKCPHCLSRFWRMDLKKLAIMVGLVVVVGVGLLFAILSRQGGI
jgi:hypothetical protein